MKAVACVVIALGIFFGVRSISASRAALTWKPPPGVPVVELRVPHAKGSIVLDGDMDDPGWLDQIARTNAFVAEDGVTPARPYSDARFVWGDGHLYVALYAADENIRATDSFHLVFEIAGVERVFDVTPLGVLREATPSDAHLSKELDGTIDDPSDDDEEWVIEMAIPFEALGLKGDAGERVGFSVRRCDTPKNGRRACGTWGGGVERGMLVLD